MCRSIRENRLVEPDFLIIIYLKKAFIVENEMFSFFYDWDLWRSCCCMLSSPRAGRVVDTNKDTYIKQQQSCTIRDKTDIQTTAGAPMPLRPPTPSVRTARVYCQAGLNCLLAVHSCRLQSSENACSFVQAREPPFSNSAPCFFIKLCHVLLHRPAGRRTWAHSTPSGEWRERNGCCLILESSFAAERVWI